MTVPPAYFGIDKAEAPASTWLRALYDASNLRITGAYIDGPALHGHPTAEFTSPSMATSRHWMERVPAASRDGWGIVLFYLGYSSGADGSAHRSVHPPTGQPTPARGQLHAQHLKHVVATQVPGWAGAVVMIDNENSESFNLDAQAEQALKNYYLALCEELTHPGPAGAPAMRPGFYLHAPVARPLLRARPDLFLWDVQIDVADPHASTTTRAPFDPRTARIEVAPALSIRPAAVAPATTGTPTGLAWSAWPVGRQFRFYTGTLPHQGSPVTRAVPALTPISTFDFDCSLVRDAAFPVAEPRIATLSGAADATVVRGSFTEPVRQGPTSPPRMDLTILGDRGAGTALAWSPDLPVEPDAPLVVVPEQMPDTILSVSRNGVALERRLVSGGWSAWSSVGAPPPSLRRLRAIAGAKRADGTTYALAVSADHRLYAQRRPRGGAWSDPAAMAGDLRLHPFSTLTATLRGADQLEVLCLDAAGNLANAWWSTLMSTWPGDAHARVESTAMLLAGGSLAAVAPASDSLLAFGVGRDLRLTATVFRSGRGWREPQPLGRPQDRLTPHARIAAQIVSPNLVEVVGISHELRLVVHRLRRTAGEWAAEPPVALPSIPPAGAPAAHATVGAAGSVEPAVGWTPNPFGDVALGRTAAGRSYVAVSALAATAPRTGAVGCFLDGQQGWWRYL